MPHKDLEQRKAYHKAYSKKHYNRNKAYYKKKNQKHKLTVAALLQELKDVPCQDCHQKFPSCAMDFDHRDPATKRINVGNAGSRSAVRKEAAKCDIVCANCHRIRTHK